MTNEKGLDPIVADRIGEYVKLKGETLFEFVIIDQCKLIKNNVL
jgi:hypothetical protein